MQNHHMKAAGTRSQAGSEGGGRPGGLPIRKSWSHQALQGLTPGASLRPAGAGVGASTGGVGVHFAQFGPGCCQKAAQEPARPRVPTLNHRTARPRVGSSPSHLSEMQTGAS